MKIKLFTGVLLIASCACPIAQAKRNDFGQVDAERAWRIAMHRSYLHAQAKGQEERDQMVQETSNKIREMANETYIDRLKPSPPPPPPPPPPNGG